MTSIEEIKKVVLDFVIAEYIEEDDTNLDFSSPLISSGVVDSFTMVTLKRFLEVKYKIAIPDDKATPKAFDTINSIAVLVKEFVD